MQMFVCLQRGPQKDTNTSLRDVLEKHPQLCYQLRPPGPGQVPVDQGDWGKSLSKEAFWKVSGWRFSQAGHSVQGPLGLSTVGLWNPSGLTIQESRQLWNPHARDWSCRLNAEEPSGSNCSSKFQLDGPASESALNHDHGLLWEADTSEDAHTSCWLPDWIGCAALASWTYVVK